MIQPGKDHAVYDSRGKRIAILLKSKCRTELELQQHKRAFEHGTGEKVRLESSPVAREGKR